MKAPAHREVPLAPALTVALGLALSGCPLPQALPDYPSTGAITPPRIRADVTTPADTLIEVGPACAAAPAYQLATTLVDENTIEPVDARWFVDYRITGANAVPQSRETILGPVDGLDTLRDVTPWSFRPYDYDPGGTAAEQQAFRDGGGLHVVELVVSNGFEEDPGPATRPYRTPKSGFETQVYRWVFHYAPDGTCGFPAP